MTHLVFDRSRVVMVLLDGSLVVLESSTNRAGYLFLQLELYHLVQEMICQGALVG